MLMVSVIMTCYNRKEYTRRCIESLDAQDLEITYIVTDDNSVDGTSEMLKQLQKEYFIHILEGNGQLYWSGGMRKGIQFAKKCDREADYYVLVNDDVQFNQDVIRRSIKQSQDMGNAVITGVTESTSGVKTYGGIRYEGKSIHYHSTLPGEACDTFNCNFVLIPKDIFNQTENFDSHYTHAMADFDYGFQIKKKGFQIYTSSFVVGICEKNQVAGTWQDKKLGCLERIRKKESVKGLPIGIWFYFLKKNFGLGTAIIRSMTPYMKIMLHK